MYQCTNGNINGNLPFIPHYIASEIHNRLLPHCQSNNEFHLIKGFYYQLISACNGSFNSSYRSISTYAKEFRFTERLVRRAISLLTDIGLITCTQSPFGKPSKTYQLKPVPLPLPVTEPKPETEALVIHSLDNIANLNSYYHGNMNLLPEPKPETVPLPLPVTEPKPEALPKPETVKAVTQIRVTEPETLPEPKPETLPEPKPETLPEPKLKPEAILEPKLKHLSEPVLMFKRKPVKISEFEPLLINEPERQIKATCTCGKPTTEFELTRWGVCSECFISSPNEFYKQCLRA